MFEHHINLPAELESKESVYIKKPGKKFKNEAKGFTYFHKRSRENWKNYFKIYRFKRTITTNINRPQI